LRRPRRDVSERSLTNRLSDRHERTKRHQGADRAGGAQPLRREGLAATSVRDIAGAAGLSDGALYRHYPSKDELVRRLFAAGFAQFAQTLERLAEGRTQARGWPAARSRRAIPTSQTSRGATPRSSTRSLPRLSVGRCGRDLRELPAA